MFGLKVGVNMLISHILKLSISPYGLFFFSIKNLNCPYIYKLNHM